MLKDDFPRGSVIQLGKYADPRTLPRTNVRIKGYPIIVSSGYTLSYWVTFIMYEDKFKDELVDLLAYNISDQIDEDSIRLNDINWIINLMTKEK